MKIILPFVAIALVAFVGAIPIPVAPPPPDIPAQDAAGGGFRILDLAIPVGPPNESGSKSKKRKKKGYQHVPQLSNEEIEKALEELETQLKEAKAEYGAAPRSEQLKKRGIVKDLEVEIGKMRVKETKAKGPSTGRPKARRGGVQDRAKKGLPEESDPKGRPAKRRKLDANPNSDNERPERSITTPQLPVPAGQGRLPPPSPHGHHADAEPPEAPSTHHASLASGSSYPHRHNTEVASTNHDGPSQGHRPFTWSPPPPGWSPASWDTPVASTSKPDTSGDSRQSPPPNWITAILPDERPLTPPAVYPVQP